MFWYLGVINRQQQAAAQAAQAAAEQAASGQPNGDTNYDAEQQQQQREREEEEARRHEEEQREQEERERLEREEAERLEMERRAEEQAAALLVEQQRIAELQNNQRLQHEQRQPRPLQQQQPPLNRSKSAGSKGRSPTRSNEPPPAQPVRSKSNKRGPLTKVIPGQRHAEMPVRGPSYATQGREVEREWEAHQQYEQQQRQQQQQQPPAQARPRPAYEAPRPASESGHRSQRVISQDAWGSLGIGLNAESAESLDLGSFDFERARSPEADAYGNPGTLPKEPVAGLPPGAMSPRSPAGGASGPPLAPRGSPSPSINRSQSATALSTAVPPRPKRKTNSAVAVPAGQWGRHQDDDAQFFGGGGGQQDEDDSLPLAVWQQQRAGVRR
jgi:hypothetical protein